MKTYCFPQFLIFHPLYVYLWICYTLNNILKIYCFNVLYVGTVTLLIQIQATIVIQPK